jgi:hypothetical protein
MFSRHFYRDWGRSWSRSGSWSGSGSGSRLRVQDDWLEDWDDRRKIVVMDWDIRHSGSMYSVEVTASSDAYYFGDEFLSRRGIFSSADRTLDYFNPSLLMHSHASVAEVLRHHMPLALHANLVTAGHLVWRFHRHQADRASFFLFLGFWSRGRRGRRCWF